MPASTPQQEMLALVDEAPMRPIQYWLWLLSCGGTLLDGFSIFALGVAMPLVVNDMGIGPGTVGLIGAAIVLGAVAGAAIGGQAGDRFGRKRLMLADMLFIALGAALSAVARGPMLLFVGQLIIGVGIGIDFPAGGAYVSEWMPKASRSRMMVATIACQSVGMLLAAALTILVLKETANPQAWHGFLAITGVIALLFSCRDCGCRKVLAGTSARTAFPPRPPRSDEFCLASGLKPSRLLPAPGPPGNMSHRLKHPKSRGLESECFFNGSTFRAQCSCRRRGFSWTLRLTVSDCSRPSFSALFTCLVIRANPSSPICMMLAAALRLIFSCWPDSCSACGRCRSSAASACRGLVSSAWRPEC